MYCDFTRKESFKKESGGRYPNGFVSRMKQTDKLCAADGFGRRLCITL